MAKTYSLIIALLTILIVSAISYPRVRAAAPVFLALQSREGDVYVRTLDIVAIGPAYPDEDHNGVVWRELLLRGGHELNVSETSLRAVSAALNDPTR